MIRSKKGPFIIAVVIILLGIVFLTVGTRGTSDNAEPTPYPTRHY